MFAEKSDENVYLFRCKETMFSLFGNSIENCNSFNNCIRKFPRISSRVLTD